MRVKYRFIFPYVLDCGHNKGYNKSMGLNGKIIINPYGVPKQSVSQAERLKEEFSALGVNTEIVSDGYMRVRAGDNGLFKDESFLQADFFVYLDKDKYLSDILERAGKRVFNGHKQIRVCDDKGETYIALAAGGFPVPETVFAPLCYSKTFPLPAREIKEIGKRLGYPVIVKESYGSMGKGVHKADNERELLALAEGLKTVPHLFQRYLSNFVGTDIRVIIVGGEAVAAMKRSNASDFRSNIALGGKGEKIDLIAAEYAEFIALSEKVSRYLGMDYCGVDLIFGDNGEPVVCEVNSNAFFDGIERVTGVNVAAKYAEYIIKICKGGDCQSTSPKSL